MNSTEEILRQGSTLLDPLLLTYGFSFHILGSGGSSGGSFAYGEFRRDDRRLELHFRYSLGMVRYHFADRSMSHQDYMRAVIGRPNASHYPGFSSDPLDGFRHLLLDLEEHGADFLTGTDACLHHRIDQAEAQPIGISKLPE